MPNSQHGGFGEVMLFFLDGKILIEARGKAGREIIQLWDVDTGHDLGALYGHTWRIQTLKFSHDGKILASGSDDGTILLWDWEKIISKAKDNKGN